MSSHPDTGDTNDMAAQLYRANLAARAERKAAIREALPGAGYWATFTTAGVATLAAWTALLTDLAHDADGRIGYGGAVVLAVAALCALATMITGAVGAHDYTANRRARRLTDQLDRQHREVLAVISDRDAAYWQGAAQSMRDLNSAAGVAILDQRRPPGTRVNGGPRN